MLTSPRLWAAGAFLALAMIATALSAHATTGELLAFDRPIVDELQEVPGGAYYEPVADFFALGFVEYPLLAVAAIVAWRGGQRPLALALLLVLAGRALNTPIKELIDRPRPTEADAIVRYAPDTPGYPSGHAQTVAIVYGYVAVVAACCLPRAWAGVSVAGAVAVMLLIGWDRVYDGVHWPSDVIGGWTIGLTLLMLAVAIPYALASDQARRIWYAVGHRMARGLGWLYGDRPDPGARQP